MTTMNTRWNSFRRGLVHDASAIAGVSLVAAGLWLWSAALALIWCGGVLLTAAIAAERKAQAKG